MLSIRRNTFETNSSSSHSIVLLGSAPDNDKYFQTIRLDKDGFYDIWFEDDLEFGRTPFNVLCTFATKLNYAIASFGEDRFDELNELACKYLRGEDGSYCTGIKLPKPRWRDGEVSYGFVDHQSSGLLDMYLVVQGISLETFLTNPKYIVIIDGDEYCVFDNLKNSGLVVDGVIEKEY